MMEPNDLMANLDYGSSTAQVDAPSAREQGEPVGTGGRSGTPSPTGPPVTWRTLPADLSPAWRRVLVVTLVVQLAFLVSVATLSALDFHFMSPIDEEAHLVYIQQIAEHGSLPVLGKTQNSWQGLALIHGTYPRPSGIDPAHDGL
jgi:hypothetical protein